MSGAAMPDASDGAQIINRGYRAYEGPRSGLPGSIRSVAFYSARYSLGLGRSARHKILPVLAMAISLIPAVVIVGISLVVNRSGMLPGETPFDYQNYYSVIAVALFFFCGIVVPDILVVDRRNGMLPLYMSTPLQRWSYLLAKVLAAALTLAIITVGPVMLFLLVYTLQGLGPSGFVEWIAAFVRIVVAGFVMSAGFTAASLAAASLTDRRAFASVGVILLLVGSGTLVRVLVSEADLTPRLHAFDLQTVTTELIDRMYGEPDASDATDGGAMQFGLEFEVESGGEYGSDMEYGDESGYSDDGRMLGYYEPDPSDADDRMLYPDDWAGGVDREGMDVLESTLSPISTLSTLFVVSAYLGWVAVGSGVVWFRYRRLVVSR